MCFACWDEAGPRGTLLASWGWDVRRHGQDAYRPTSIASSVSTRSRACSTSSRSMWGGAEKSGARAQLARAGCGLEAIAVIAMAAIAMPGRCKAATDLHVCLGKFVQIRRLDAARVLSAHGRGSSTHGRSAPSLGVGTWAAHAPATSRAPLARFCLAGLQRLQVVHCVGAGEATRGEGPAKGHAARTGHRGARLVSITPPRVVAAGVQAARPWCRRAAAR